tara:strand:+ start:349 stop:1551 length:1203 start_codon:yes stop_codon:yes gene_type:complete
MFTSTTSLTPVFFTAGVELEYKCGIGYQEMNRRLQAAGFTWANAMYDGSPSPDAETIFAPMPVDENGIMDCAQGDVARLIEFLESEGADCPTAVTGLGMHTHIGNRLVKMDPAAYWQESKNARTAGHWFQPDADQMTDVMSIALLKDVVMRYADHQDEIDAVLAPSRRERGGASRWCHSIRLIGYHGAYRDQFENATSVQRMSTVLGSLGECTKYSAINLDHWSGKNTIEFRQHQGTLSLDKINHWVGLLVSIITHSDQTRMKYPTLETVQTPIMPHRPASRLGIVWGMCRRDGGVHVQDIMAATGWDAATVRARVSEWRSRHGDQAVITHTQQSYGHRYGTSNGAHDQCGYEIPETYQRGEAGDVELLPANRAGVTSIWGGVSDDAFEWFNERRDSLRR